MFENTATVSQVEEFIRHSCTVKPQWNGLDLNLHRQKITNNRMVYDQFTKTDNWNLLKDLVKMTATGEYTNLTKPDLCDQQLREVICGVWANAITCDDVHGDDAVNIDGIAIELKSCTIDSKEYIITENGSVKSTKAVDKYLSKAAVARFKQYSTTQANHYDKPTFFFLVNENWELIDCRFMEGKHVSNLIYRPNASYTDRHITLPQFTTYGHMISHNDATGFSEWKKALPESENLKPEYVIGMCEVIRSPNCIAEMNFRYANGLPV